MKDRTLLRKVFAALAAAALAAGMAALSASGAGATPGDADGDGETAQERRERILEYWTPERVRNAVPLLPVLPGPAHHRPDHGGGPPGDGGDDDDDSTSDGTVTGAPWEGSSDEGTVGETTGKVLLTLDGTDYVCSGSTLAGPSGQSFVLSAGHCVHDGDGSADSWATNWIFIPAYEDGGSFDDCDATIYGCWTAGDLRTTTTWYSSSEWADDAGFAVMDPGGKTGESKDLVSTVGAQTISFTSTVVGTEIYAFGYPAARKYKGRDLIYCAGTAVDGVFEGTAGLDCDMTGGSSGGPWYHFDTATETGTAVSVNSHIFRSIKDRIFGPVFDGEEEKAYKGDAESRSADSS